ncbi:unnamed protein product [Bursaphelenchus xylophilus]|nr:unnamed protein product [Bursaphelenchus xylophilus]CAG9123528.1 unnamed protein product [Bursaphelenchus xylophilus]
MVWVATILYWITVTRAQDLEEIEKCYSCSSTTFAHRWPRTQNSTYLFIRDPPIVANETCDNMKSALPVVPCPNSVCVKFVLVETSANRAVCSALQSPIIVRDCWSRILHSDDPDLQLRPLDDKPVPLIGMAESDRTIGAVYTCNGYLCNSSSLLNVKSTLILVILLAMTIVFRVK